MPDANIPATDRIAVIRDAIAIVQDLSLRVADLQATVKVVPAANHLHVPTVDNLLVLSRIRASKI